MEVLYDAMSNGSKRLTVREFLHCYRPDEIDKSRGIYSFAPRSPLLKVIFETPDSNRDWKSRYFFLEGDEWMCRPGDAEHMPVDTTWGILHPSGMHPSYRVTTLFNRSTYYVFFFFSILLTVHFFCSSTATTSWFWGVQLSRENFC